VNKTFAETKVFFTTPYVFERFKGEVLSDKSVGKEIS
jgi:hypothetical protein